jgi:cellulose synthase (UDP-forming)
VTIQEFEMPPPEFERAPARATRQSVWKVPSVSAMTSRERKQYLGLVAIWAALTLHFWIWWLNPNNVGNIALFVMLTASMFYVFAALPTAYLFFVGHMRIPAPVVPKRAEDAGVIGQVAVVTLTVPGSESLDIVERQLAAMAGIRYPHDSWILVDKVHSPEIEQLAESYGVRYFSRHDVDRWGPENVARWNDPLPPFQRKTKAGNINSWFDAFGDDYTHFTQLDIDHNPNPDYLDHVLGYFADPDVAWVQAPSVYGNHEDWTSRGSSEQEFVLQGPLQQGFYGFSKMPFIIGSHCTYDMAAIKNIGGFQPTRAEDHLDTVILASKGKEGVFVPKVIAVGDGPETFDTYLAQQFAWAYSMFQVLFNWTPKLIRKYTLRQAVQCLFVQTWYLSWSLSMLLLFLSPLLALASNSPISTVSFWMFYLHSLPPAILSFIIWRWTRRWFSPRGMSLTWRGVVLHAARWVVVLSALVQVIFKVQKPYMITVKGMGTAEERPYRLTSLVPYIGLVVTGLAVCWLHLLAYGPSNTQGLLYFALTGALVFVAVMGVVVFQDYKQRLAAGATPVRTKALFRKAIGTVTALALAWVGTAIAATPQIVDALRYVG